MGADFSTHSTARIVNVIGRERGQWTLALAVKRRTSGHLPAGQPAEDQRHCLRGEQPLDVIRRR